MMKRLIAVVVTFLAVLMVLIGGFCWINHSSTEPNRMLTISEHNQDEIITEPAKTGHAVALADVGNEYNHRDLGLYRIERALNGGFVAKNSKRSIPLYDANSKNGGMRTDRNLLGIDGGHYLNLDHSVYRNLKSGMMLVIEP